MRIYLDNFCFNRPFDDQSPIRNRLESEAKLRIQDDIVENKFELVWSYILEAENIANPFEERMNAISDWRNPSKSNKDEAAMKSRLPEKLWKEGNMLFSFCPELAIASNQE